MPPLSVQLACAAAVSLLQTPALLAESSCGLTCHLEQAALCALTEVVRVVFLQARQSSAAEVAWFEPASIGLRPNTLAPQLGAVLGNLLH